MQPYESPSHGITGKVCREKGEINCYPWPGSLAKYMGNTGKKSSLTSRKAFKVQESCTKDCIDATDVMSQLTGRDNI